MVDQIVHTRQNCLTSTGMTHMSGITDHVSDLISSQNGIISACYEKRVIPSEDKSVNQYKYIYISGRKGKCHE